MERDIGIFNRIDDGFAQFQLRAVDAVACRFALIALMAYNKGNVQFPDKFTILKLLATQIIDHCMPETVKALTPSFSGPRCSFAFNIAALDIATNRLAVLVYLQPGKPIGNAFGKPSLFVALENEETARVTPAKRGKRKKFNSVDETDHLRKNGRR